MAKFDYIKWVTDNKRSLLTEQAATGSGTGSATGSGTGSVPTCYICDTTASMNGQNGQFTEPAFEAYWMNPPSYDYGNGYCSSGPPNWYSGKLDPNSPSYTNCTGSGVTTTPTTGSATGSSGTTTTTGTGGTTPINLEDPCEEFETRMDRREQEDICRRCAQDPSDPMCRCCPEERQRDDRERGRERGRGDLGEQRTNTHYNGNCCEWCIDLTANRAIGNYPPEGCEDWNCNDCSRGGTSPRPSIQENNKNNKMKKSQLRKLVREAIKEVLIEQTTAECQQIYALTDPASNLSFPGCCETTQNWVNWNPNQPNDPCKTIRAQAMAINPNFAACCDPNYTGDTRGNCDDPLWVGMPAPNKSEYCNRCTEYGAGVAVNGIYPVQLSAGSPYYTNDPNGLSYCHCCDGGTSDMDCENPEWVAQNPNAALKCFVCRQATQGCEQLSNIPMSVAAAQAAGLTLYSDQPTCQAQSECGPGTGDRCSNPVGSYDVYNQQSDHNEDWGLGCWFCHPEHGNDPGQGCQMVQVPMDQQWAYQGYIAGTTGLYTNAAACEADPITKCGDDDPGGKMVSCLCCDGQDGISMATQVPAVPGCSVFNGGNLSKCVLHPVSGGAPYDPKYCKKPGTGGPGIPDDNEPMAMVKPIDDKGKKVRREQRIMMKNIIKNILRK